MAEQVETVMCPYCYDLFRKSTYELHNCQQKPKPSVVDEILKARGGATGPYGPFYNNAEVSQKIKDIMRRSRSWDKLDLGEKEALDQIALKMSRIVTGNDPHYLDNWDDIQGYVRIVADRLRQGTGE